MASEHGGVVGHVPPETWLDPIHNPGAPIALSEGETARISFGLVVNGEELAGGRSFMLRRPPMVLAHGLWGSPQTWNPQMTPWHDTPGSGFETRLYRVDYEDLHDSGYNRIWSRIPEMIEAALGDYRTASDGAGHHPDRGFKGVRYAATRVDVVGHSMGGVLTRLYISDLAISNVLREKFVQRWLQPGAWEPHPDYVLHPIFVDRGSGSLPRERDYLTHANYGAGSIRRFISIGGPFDGSDWGRVAAENWTLKEAARELKEAAQNPKSIVRRIEFERSHNLGGVQVEIRAPEALIDLTPNSTMQRQIDGANFPAGHRRVRWHPITSVATQTLPATVWVSAIWNGVLALPSFITDGAASTANGANGDLIVLLSSQANGQQPVTNPLGSPRAPFTNTVHAPFPGMQNFNVINQTASPAVADRVKRMLGTNDPADWIGDLQP